MIPVRRNKPRITQHGTIWSCRSRKGLTGLGITPVAAYWDWAHINAWLRYEPDPVIDWKPGWFKL